jgi:hypothetical protein
VISRPTSELEAVRFPRRELRACLAGTLPVHISRAAALLSVGRAACCIVASCIRQTRRAASFPRAHLIRRARLESPSTLSKCAMNGWGGASSRTEHEHPPTIPHRTWTTAPIETRPKRYKPAAAGGTFPSPLLTGVDWERRQQRMTLCGPHRLSIDFAESVAGRWSCHSIWQSSPRTRWSRAV